MTIPISVSNAGLVILQSFIKPYFEKLGLIKDHNEFVSATAKEDAVHYLQYLVTGQSDTEEQHLVLNKLLCGLETKHPVASGLDISPTQKELGDSLIEAMIGYWPQIGASTVGGFRGNWLVRQGSLTEEEAQWDLVVAERPYDILLQRAPFSYAVTKLPWMLKPLYVSWPA